MNLYIKCGSHWIAESEERVEILHRMSLTSIFYNVQKGLCKSSNADGCFLMQMTLQYLKDSDMYNAFCEEALSKTFERMRLLPMNEVLKGVLLGNVFSMFIYNSEATYKYLENKRLTVPFLEEIMILDIAMKHVY